MIAETTYKLAWEFLNFFGFLLLLYFIVLNGLYLALTLYAFRGMRRESRRAKAAETRELLELAGSPPVTIVMPGFNEEIDAPDAVAALLDLDYPDYEVIFVNDGSTDGTLRALVDRFALEPAPQAVLGTLRTAPIREVYRSGTSHRLWVIDKVNGGKGDALNAGLNRCRTPFVCTIDADTLLEKNALTRGVRPFLLDEHTIAAGALVRIVNGCEIENGRVVNVRLPASWLARFQVVEYLRTFLASRVGWSALNSTLVISGAFGMFRRSALERVGGFATDTVTEDMELVVRLHRFFRENKIPYRIAFVPETVAWTECPENLLTLGHQRHRWQRGLMECMARHRPMLLHPRYGKVGILAFPFYYFLEFLGPVIELCGYCVFVLLGVFNSLLFAYAFAFVSVAVLLGATLSIAAIGLEELTFQRYTRTRDLLILFCFAVLENIGYRQIMTFWRVKGMVDISRNGKKWGRIPRKGFVRGVSERATA